MSHRERELRCDLCVRRPLLATYGINEKEQVFIHVKIWKARRIFGELIIEEGSKVRLRCRECGRWHVIKLIGKHASLEETFEELPILNTP
jgi:hypothetical protein